MVRLSVLYPATPGSHFDWDYYLTTHVAMANVALRPLGLVRMEIDKGLSGFPPGTPVPYHCVAHLIFNTQEELDRALAEAAPGLIADVPNYTGVSSIPVVYEMVDV